MDICHIIYDAYSSSVLHHDLKRIMNGERIPVDTGILRAVAYDESLRSSDDYKRTSELLYREIISSDVSRSDEPMYVVGVIAKTISSNGLKECAARFGTSSGFLLSSIFAYAVCKVMKERKCSLTLLDSGRSDMDHSDSIGLLTKFLDVSISGDIEDIYKFVKTGLSDIYRYTDADMVPVWSHDDDRRYVTRYMFDYINIETFRPPVEIEYPKKDKLLNDLFALIQRSSDKLMIAFTHSDFFDCATVESIMGHFIEGIEKLIRDN